MGKLHIINLLGKCNIKNTSYVWLFVEIKINILFQKFQKRRSPFSTSKIAMIALFPSVLFLSFFKPDFLTKTWFHNHVQQVAGYFHPFFKLKITKFSAHSFIQKKVGKFFQITRLLEQKKENHLYLCKLDFSTRIKWLTKT